MKAKGADELDVPLRRTRNRRSNSDGVTGVHGAEILHPVDGTVLPSVNEDSSVALEPPSPGSPPKKLWERQFGSFRRKGSKGDLPPTGAISSPHMGRAISSPHMGRAKKMPSPFSKDRRVVATANGGPSLPPIVSSSSQDKGEGSVRGGKLFANMFRGNVDHGATSTPTHSRRVKSFSHSDELDGTMRRGSEKGLNNLGSESPGRHRYRKEVPQVPVLTASKSGSPWMPPSTLIGMTGAVKSAPESSSHPLAIPRDFKITSAYLSQPPIPVNLSPSTNTTSTNTDPFTPPGSTPPSGEALLDVSSSSAMKKAFTEFHNSSRSGHDAVSAYLGDEHSGRSHSLAWTQNHSHLAENGPSLQMAVSHGHLSSLEGLEYKSTQSLQENVSIFKSMRMLKAIQGVESWKSGRRYLIAPAALSASPLSVVTTLAGSRELIPAARAADMKSAFGGILLGDCLLTYATGTNAPTVVQHWSSATLVLRQNYLLEYNQDSKVLSGLPRGYAHLQYSECKEHPVFSDALELHFYGSPCAKSDKRILMIRLMQRDERDAWKICLNRASSLSVRDLYDYDGENHLGCGQYASVFPARRHTEVTGTQAGSSPHTCAVKVFDKAKFWRVVVKGRERADTLVRETSVQATLTAKCGRILSILRIRGFFETSEHVVLELELLEGIDLFKHISSKGTLSEKEAAAILRDILQGLEAMNKIGIAHRDVKPANVLMCKKHLHGSFVKVCDFGMATFVGVDGQVRGRCGTPGYVAPEIFTAGVHGGYGNKVDVFSAGVTLYVMLCGYEPFYGETDDELVEANKKADVEFPNDEWGKISAPARDLVKKMMKRSPNDRLNAKEALQHSWFASVLNDSDALDGSMSLPSCDAPEDGACVIL